VAIADVSLFSDYVMDASVVLVPRDPKYCSAKPPLAVSGKSVVVWVLLARMGFGCGACILAGPRHSAHYTVTVELSYTGVVL